jgi:hypothetical protein
MPTALIDAICESGLVKEFDWGAWADECMRYIAQPELIGGADLDTCSKLLTSAVRADRFTANHFGQLLQSGHIAHVLHRLDYLRHTLPQFSIST